MIFLLFILFVAVLYMNVTFSRNYDTFSWFVLVSSAVGSLAALLLVLLLFESSEARFPSPLRNQEWGVWVSPLAGLVASGVGQLVGMFSRKLMPVD